MHCAEGVMMFLLKLRKLRLEQGAADAEGEGTSVSFYSIFVWMQLRMVSLSSLAKTQME